MEGKKVKIFQQLNLFNDDIDSKIKKEKSKNNNKLFKRFYIGEEQEASVKIKCSNCGYFEKQIIKDLQNYNFVVVCPHCEGHMEQIE